LSGALAAQVPPLNEWNFNYNNAGDGYCRSRAWKAIPATGVITPASL
jgi:hypothetical protein